jgi:hypothetical protein
MGSVLIIVDGSHTELVTMVVKGDEARELNELKAMIGDLAAEVEDIKRGLDLTQDRQQTYQQQTVWYGGEQELLTSTPILGLWNIFQAPHRC